MVSPAHSQLNAFISMLLVPCFAYSYLRGEVAPCHSRAVLLYSVTETCRDVLCLGSSTCVVDQNNNANCVTCNRICPEPTSPEQYLCGNDGITYASACHLRKATCLLGRSIGLAYEGKCISKYSIAHGERVEGILRRCIPALEESWGF